MTEARYLVRRVVAYIVVAPLGCTTTASSDAAASTTCTNLVGIDYSGTGVYRE